MLLSFTARSPRFDQVIAKNYERPIAVSIRVGEHMVWSETTISASQVIHSDIHQFPVLDASFLTRFYLELVTVS